jgi:hypothetical protein
MAMHNQLMETAWFHAANFIWLYDATGMGKETKMAIGSSVNLQITKMSPEQNYQLINKGNRLAILLPDNKLLYQQKSKDSMRVNGIIGEITEDQLRVTDEDLQHPDSQVQTIEGFIADASMTYNPRWFSLVLQKLDVNDVSKNAIGLYKNPARIARTKASCIYGNVQSNAKQPLAWALVKLNLHRPDNPATPDISEEKTMVFEAQTNQLGDFYIALSEMDAVDVFASDLVFDATFSIKACAQVNGYPNPDQVQNNLPIKSFDDADNFVDSLNFEMSPGSHKRLQSANEKSLIVNL